MTAEELAKLQEEVAVLRATNAHLFLAIHALATIVFAPPKLMGPESDREKVEAEVREQSRTLDKSLNSARALIWPEDPNANS